MLLLPLLLVTAQPAANPAAWEAAPRTKEYPWMSVATWKQMHDGHLARTKKGGVEVVFLGDSITQGWGRGRGVEEALRAAERRQLRHRR